MWPVSTRVPDMIAWAAEGYPPLAGHPVLNQRGEVAGITGSRVASGVSPYVIHNKALPEIWLMIDHAVARAHHPLEERWPFLPKPFPPAPARKLSAQ